MTFDAENDPKLIPVLDVELTSKPVTAHPGRELAAGWKVEKAKPLQAFYSPEVMDQMWMQMRVGNRVWHRIAEGVPPIEVVIQRISNGPIPKYYCEAVETGYHFKLRRDQLWWSEACGAKE